MTAKEYKEAKGIRRSDLYVLYSRSPLHMKYEIENPEPETLSLLEGRVAHKLILEPESFKEEFAVAPQCDKRTKEGKEIYSAFLAEHGHKEVITSDSFEKISAMAEAVRENKQASAFLKGKHELSFFWTDPDTKERCKVRPDCIAEVDGEMYIVDYKTTESCADGHFERSVKKYGYKFQAGMYREGVFQNTYDEYKFAFVAQEKKAPYAVRVYICNEDFIQEGYEQFRTAIGKYHWCNENNIWYGYEGPEGILSELYGEGEY